MILPSSPKPGSRSDCSQAEKRSGRAFTRIELVAIIAAAGLLIALMLPAFAADTIRTQRAVCVNNLSRIGQALASWATDHNERYPWDVDPASGGTMGQFNARYAYFQFAAISNELVTPASLACPADGSKSRLNTFGPSFGDNYVSYMLSHPLLSEGRAISSGDRNVTPSQSEGCSEFSSARWLSRPSTNAGWDLRVHVNTGHLLFNDGSVEGTDNSALRSALSPAGASNNFHYVAP